MNAPLAIATALMWTGAVLGVMGILGGALLVFAWINDRWLRRHTHNHPRASARSAEKRKRSFTSHRLTP